MESGITVSLNRGTDTLFFSESSPFRIVAGGLRGFDYPETDVELACGTDGKRFYIKSTALCARRMSIRFEVAESTQSRYVRDLVSRMTLPGRAVTLSTCFLGRKRTATVIPADAPEYIFDSFGTPMQIVLHFIAEKPYFTEGKTLRVTAPVARAAMTFPVSFPKGGGVLVSFTDDINSAVIRNPGDTDCPVKAYIYAEGTVSQPYIMLGEKKIRLTGNLTSGDVLKIESGDDMHKITVNGAVRSDLDRNSRFFSLEPGDNKVTLGAASGASSLRSYFEYEPRYFGI